MTLDLGDRRVADAIRRLVRGELAAAFRERQAITHIGVVFGAPDATLRKVAVQLFGQSEPAPGFSYGRVAPAEGDLVRVVIDPRGDRYISEVLTADEEADIAASFDIIGESLLLHDRLNPEFARLYLGVLQDVFVQRQAGLPAVWLDPNVYTPGGVFSQVIQTIGNILAGDRLYVGAGVVTDTYFRRASAGIAAASGLAVDSGGVADFSEGSVVMPAAAKRLRHVPLGATISPFAAVTSTVDWPVSFTPDLGPTIPANAFAVSGEIIVRSSDGSAASMSVYSTPPDFSVIIPAAVAYASGVAGRGGGVPFIATLAGNKIRWSLDWISGTVTYWMDIWGYWTHED